MVTVFNEDMYMLKDCLYFPRGLDPEGIADLILYIHDHEEEARARAKKAAFVVEKFFSWANVVKSYLEIYAR